MSATSATPHTTRHPFAPQPARQEDVLDLLRVLARGGPWDEHEIRQALGLPFGSERFSAALREARMSGMIKRWRKSKWYSGIWILSDAGRAKLDKLEEQEAKVEDEYEPVSAYAHTDVRAEIVEDYALEYEWRLSLADAIEEESAFLKYIVRRLNDAQTIIPILQTQLLRANRRIAALERELADARSTANFAASAQDFVERVLRLNVDEMSPLDAMTELMSLQREARLARTERDTLAASETAPAAVRMDRASQRQPKTAWTPPKRNPAA